MILQPEFYQTMVLVDNKNKIKKIINDKGVDYWGN